MKNSAIRAIISIFILVLAVLIVGLTGCIPGIGTIEVFHASRNISEASERVSVSVGLLAEDLDFFQAKSREESFIELLPNVEIDFQQYKDSEEMIKNQKIRQAANELPDVIYIKPDHILELENSLLPWNENEELVKKNKFVSVLSVNSADGHSFYGLPMKVFSEWTYYRKSIFKELNLQVPETWDDFINTAKAIKADGKYIPIAMGGKDSWPCYPFNEFMPLVVGKNTGLLSDIAKQEEPFGEGSAFDRAYKMVDRLYMAELMGKPLDTSWSEAEQLMASKRAAMLVAGQYFLPDYKNFGGDMDDIEVFPLPMTNDKAEPMRTTVMIDLFLGVSKNSKNVDLAKKYVEWLFSPEVYKAYISNRYMTSTISGVDSDNIFTRAIKTQKIETFMYVPGDENYTKLVSETKWDTKAIGTMMLAGKNYKTILSEYNKKWKAAITKLGIK